MEGFMEEVTLGGALNDLQDLVKRRWEQKELQEEGMW